MRYNEALICQVGLVVFGYSVKLEVILVAGQVGVGDNDRYS